MAWIQRQVGSAFQSQINVCLNESEVMPDMPFVTDPHDGAVFVSDDSLGSLRGER